MQRSQVGSNPTGHRLIGVYVLIAIVTDLVGCQQPEPPLPKVPGSAILLFEAPRVRSAILASKRADFLNRDVNGILGSKGDTKGTPFSIGSMTGMVVANASDAQLNQLKNSAEGLQGVLVYNYVHKLELPEAATIVENIRGMSSRIGPAAPASSSCIRRSLQPRNSHHLDLLDLHPDDGFYCSPVQSAAKMDVFVLDTGIEKTHDGFAGMEINVYDARDIWWKYSAWTPMTDVYGHGTHVAGIIASKLFGVTPNVVLHSVKVLDDTGHGTTSTLLNGFALIESWLQMNPSKKAVINLSLSAPSDSMVKRAVTNLLTQYGERVVAAVAAGNSAKNACSEGLPAVEDAITVASVSSKLKLSSFSNYGSCVDVHAPGESIQSTYLNNKFAILSGTSMAAPVVAGVLAQYWLQHPEMTGSALRVLIFDQTASEVQVPGLLSGLNAGCPNKLARFSCQGACGGLTSAPACDSYYCLNGGTCLSKGAAGLACSCPAGSSGERCEIQSNCSPNPCLNGGNCTVVGASFRCSCPPGTAGDRCTTPCSSQPCLNGGNCTDKGSTYQCACRTSFAGSRCDVPVKECTFSPCQNGGTCQDTSSGGYVCGCPSEYTGEKCQTLRTCLATTCLNGGTCIAANNQHTCQCPSAFVGLRCELSSNAKSSCSPNPCKNGGTCTESGSGYICACPLRVWGALCEKQCLYSFLVPCLFWDY